MGKSSSKTKGGAKPSAKASAGSVSSKTIMWVVVAVAVVVAGYFLFKPADAGGVRNIDAAEVATAISQGNVRIIDVRTAGEFQMGHLAGAENVPIDQLAASMGSWDKSQTLLVYCATGSRSATAVQTLQGAGFTDILHLAAGIVSWQGELEKGVASAPAPSAATSGTPVMYEFYTDW